MGVHQKGEFHDVLVVDPRQLAASLAGAFVTALLFVSAATVRFRSPNPQFARE